MEVVIHAPMVLLSDLQYSFVFRMGLPLCFFLVLLLSVCCKTVCTVKNLTYSRGEEVPDVSPCETCLCQPPEVKCSAVKCQPNTGCRILQQPNTCCPVYKCGR
ncbi:unnamed protein product [Nesidiocoris tenuis]|uniref:VWFC domain-containing protein n=1 Tax=Nesidiocoris tenuis TaxID=355587 RepID=A0A6H5FWD1_9HEMI|nr:unnamed protein product [Nesidiocoris tenuis]CAA9994209.1 unnamed protein product [Nesidiocoris tenuis]